MNVDQKIDREIIVDKLTSDNNSGIPTLNDIEDSNVAVVHMALDGCRDHHVLWLQQTSHHITDSGASNLGYLLFCCQRSVASHEEVKTRSGG